MPPTAQLTTITVDGLKAKSKANQHLFDFVLDLKAVQLFEATLNLTILNHEGFEGGPRPIGHLRFKFAKSVGQLGDVA